MIGGILLQLATLLVAVLKGVVSLTLLSRQGPEFYASLSQFLILATFFGSVLSLQLDAAAVRFAAGRPETLARILGSSLSCVAVAGLLLILLMAAAGGELSPLVYDRPGWRLPMLLAAASSTLTALLLVAYSSLQAQSAFRRLARFQIVQYSLQIVAIAVAVGHASEVVVMSALVCSDAAVLLVLLAILVRRRGIGRPDMAYLRLALPFALPLLASFFLTWLIHASGRFVLVNTHGLVAVAPYAATFTIAALSGLLTPPFVNVLYPQVTRRQTAADDAGPLLGRALGVYLILSAPLVLAMVMLGRPLVELASGPGFYAGPVVMSGIALGFLFTGMTRLAGLLLLATDKTRAMMFYLAVGAASSLGLAVLAVPTHGADALAAAYALGFLLPLLLVLHKVGLGRLGITGRLLLVDGLRLLLALGGMAAVLHQLPAQELIGLLVSAPAAMMVYALVALAVGLVRRDELGRGIALLRRKLDRGS